MLLGNIPPSKNHYSNLGRQETSYLGFVLDTSLMDMLESCAILLKCDGTQSLAKCCLTPGWLTNPYLLKFLSIPSLMVCSPTQI